jgi:ubiquinone/menaquinone biosynthesis C-methylase UbiE
MKQEEYARIQMNFFQNVLKDLGVDITAQSTVLDFGSGEGWVVYNFRKQGIKAYGVDIESYCPEATQRYQEEQLVYDGKEIFRMMDMKNYRIPFEDNTFDVVISDQVFEHVQNYPEALAEIKRVLKPGGCGLHVIPSRYRFIEGHVFIPLATVIRSYPYLAFWAFLGVRNEYQQGLGWREVAKLNYDYLRNCTTYYKKPKIRRLILNEFGNVAFVESLFLKHNVGRINQYLYPLSKVVPGIPALFSTFHSRLAFFKKLSCDKELSRDEHISFSAHKIASPR